LMIIVAEKILSVTQNANVNDQTAVPSNTAEWRQLPSY
jgi:hypothetical protein